MFIRLLTGLVNGSNHTKCVPLNNQKCEITGTNEYKILIKDKSCECKCRFDGEKRNSDQ